MKPLDFIFAARPMLHLPLWSVFLVTFHYHAQLSGKQFGLYELGLMAIISITASGAYYLNQVFDYETDRKNNKLGFLRYGYINKNQMILLFTVLSLVAVISAVIYSYMTLFFTAQLVVLGYLYSAPPFTLKNRAVWGLIANSWGYGIVVSCMVMPEISVHNGGLLGWDNPLYFFCAIGAVYLLTTLHDKEGDKQAGKKTVGVILPEFVLKLLSSLFLLGSAYFAWNSEYFTLFYLALVSIIPVLCSLFIRKAPVLHLATKLPIFLLTLLAGWFYPFYLMFIVALLILTRIYYAKRFKMIYPKLT